MKLTKNSDNSFLLDIHTGISTPNLLSSFLYMATHSKLLCAQAFSFLLFLLESSIIRNCNK